jgi:hypothetical protein
MPLATIVLKNNANVDQTFTLSGVTGNSVSYIMAGSSLLATRKLDIVIKRGKATNRIVGKLSVPSVGVNPSTGISGVQWTEVGSFDLSSVLSADSAAALDFAAMFGSLANHAATKTPYATGVFA